ncbi:hypothetical protein Hanom_Chr13g01191291 [Helianthus anomalus]
MTKPQGPFWQFTQMVIYIIVSGLNHTSLKTGVVKVIWLGSSSLRIWGLCVNHLLKS